MVMYLPILGDPGAASWDDAIFLGESFYNKSGKPSPENITPSRLVALGSQKMIPTKH